MATCGGGKQLRSCAAEVYATRVMTDICNDTECYRPYLILGSVANEPLTVCETDVGRGSTITHVVGDNFDAVVLPYSHTTTAGIVD